MNDERGPSYSSLLSLQELATRVSSQIDSAHAEIGETRAILKDAIERLIPAFTANEVSHDTATGSAPDAAFSALQFQDISDQLLAHAQTRLASLLEELNLLLAALKPANGPGHSSQHFVNVIEKANDNLAALDLSLVKPVGKAHLGAGDMELF